MITRKIVFVVGAGGSCEFGYPSGRQLLEIIYKELTTPDTNLKLAGLGFTIKDLTNFKDSLYKSNVNSIDFFLKNRPEFNKLGKTLITIVLMKYEKNAIVGFNDTWLRYLWNVMTENCDKDTFIKNQVVFITFNYDRVIEHFLHSSLVHLYNLLDNQILEILKRVQIIHIFGKLGSLPWEGGSDSRGYNSHTDNFNLAYKIGESLKTIHEIENANENLAQELTSLYLNASNIIFLGCAYHHENLQILALDKIKPSNGLYIFGSTKGLSGNERKRINADLCGKLIALPEGDWDNLKILKDHWQFRN